MMRIDTWLTEEGYLPSRAKAKEMILNGAVYCDGIKVDKPSFTVKDGVKIEVRDDPLLRYVGRGGLKLEAALDAFSVSVTDKVAMDIGASSGGFTDCLLQRGAAFVYAVDSGNGQLHPKLGKDQRVCSMEGCNARYLQRKDFPTVPTLAVMDVSFISQTLLYPAIYHVMARGGTLISLIKPQFELDRAALGKGGIVKDEKKRAEAIKRVTESAEAIGFTLRGMITSPITGGDGNTEYLAAFDLPAHNEEDSDG